jgi:hypothetical protein
MSAAAILVVSMVGFFLGMMLFAAILRWVQGVHETLRSVREGTGGRANVAAAAVLSSGPWLLLAAGIFGYSVRREAWAPWLLVGFLGAGLLVSTAWIRVRDTSLTSRDSEGAKPALMNRLALYQETKRGSIVMALVIACIVWAVIAAVGDLPFPLLVVLGIGIVATALLNALYLRALLHPEPWKSREETREARETEISKDACDWAAQERAVRMSSLRARRRNRPDSAR